MQKIMVFVQESYHEMKNKVAWPKYRDLQNSSVLVLVASLIFALIIGLFDLVFEEALNWFYSEF